MEVLGGGRFHMSEVPLYPASVDYWILALETHQWSASSHVPPRIYPGGGVSRGVLSGEGEGHRAGLGWLDTNLSEKLPNFQTLSVNFFTRSSFKPTDRVVNIDLYHTS